jgi:hypothetical protein
MAINALRATEFGIHFVWSKPNLGYCLDDQASCPQEWLIEESERPFTAPFLVEHPDSTTRESFEPLEDDDDGQDRLSFTDLAYLPPTKSEILAFANRYGWLGVSQPVTGGCWGSHVVRGESLARWRREIYAMRTAADLWRWTVAGDGPAILRRVIHWDQKKQAVLLQIPWEDGTRPSGIVPPYRHTSVIASRGSEHAPGIYPELYPDLCQRLSKGDYGVAGNTALIALVNTHLQGLASPCLLLDRKREIHQHIRPHHLLGALWLQLYLSVLKIVRVKQPCIYCGGYMDMTGTQRRSKIAHQQCIDREKTKRSRQRHAQLDAIAGQLKKPTLSPIRRAKILARRKKIKEGVWRRSAS